MRGRGGYIGFNRVPAAAAFNSAASGVWSLREAEELKRAGTWPTTDFAPNVLSGLQLWLDASDATTLFNATSGGSLVAADGGVARWEDKSGNARHATQGTSGNRPLRKTTVQGGKDVLRFDGSNDFLTSTDFLDLSSGQAITLLVVCKRSVTDAFHTIISKFDGLGGGGNESSEDGWGFRFSNTNKLNLYLAKDASYTQFTSDTDTESAFTLFAFKATAGSLTTTTALYQNGTTLAASSTGSVQTLDNTAYPVRIGIEPYAGVNYSHLNGDISEIIIYNSALSDNDRGLVETYLMVKWGIT
jgi:hypothetical protein